MKIPFFSPRFLAALSLAFLVASATTAEVTAIGSSYRATPNSTITAR